MKYENLLKVTISFAVITLYSYSFNPKRRDSQENTDQVIRLQNRLYGKSANYFVHAAYLEF